MAFPTSTPSYTGFTAGHNLQQDSHAAQHNSEQADIISLSNKVGTGASTPTSGVFLRGNGVGTSAWSSVNVGSADVTGTLPVANGGTGATTAAQALVNLGSLTIAQVYPIGCIYTDVTGTNPATTFGFGAWSQFGQGQVLVGQKPADVNFGTGGGTGGATTHTHTLSDSAYAQAYFHDAGGNSFVDARSISAGVSAFTSSERVTSTGVTTGVNSTSATPLAGSTDSGSNLMPYVTVYFWQRTA